MASLNPMSEQDTAEREKENRFTRLQRIAHSKLTPICTESPGEPSTAAVAPSEPSPASSENMFAMSEFDSDVHNGPILGYAPFGLPPRDKFAGFGPYVPSDPPPPELFVVGSVSSVSDVSSIAVNNAISPLPASIEDADGNPVDSSVDNYDADLAGAALNYHEFLNISSPAATPVADEATPVATKATSAAAEVTPVDDNIIGTGTTGAAGNAITQPGSASAPASPARPHPVGPRPASVSNDQGRGHSEPPPAPRPAPANLDGAAAPVGNGSNPREHFPQLPLSPIHRNILRGRDANVASGYVPGDEKYAPPGYARIADGAFLSGTRHEVFQIGNTYFTVPIALFTKYASFRLLFYVARPAQGYQFPNLDPAVFGLLLEVLLSPAGLSGTEPGLNLFRLVLVLELVVHWQMDDEVAKVGMTIRKYIACRIFARNPYRPDQSGAMDHNYYVFRSEELYRAWKALKAGPEAAEEYVEHSELIAIYATVIPADLWPALTTNFDAEFTMFLDMTVQLRAVPVAADFPEWWRRMFQRTGYLNFNWFGDMPQVLDRLFADAQERYGRDNGPG